MLNLGARVYEKIGDDSNAYETAQLGLTEQKKKAVICDCRCVLGRIAARKGDIDEATRQYRKACDEAHDARVYVMEIIAAKEWKRCYPDNLDCDTFIEKACRAMGKNRAEFDNFFP